MLWMDHFSRHVHVDYGVVAALLTEIIPPNSMISRVGADSCDTAR